MLALGFLVMVLTLMGPLVSNYLLGIFRVITLSSWGFRGLGPHVFSSFPAKAKSTQMSFTSVSRNIYAWRTLETIWRKLTFERVQGEREGLLKLTASARRLYHQLLTLLTPLGGLQTNHPFQSFLRAF